MLKFHFRDNTGVDVALFGLSAKNLDKLQEDMPIPINLAQLGMRGHVTIMFTEHDRMAGMGAQRRRLDGTFTDAYFILLSPNSLTRLRESQMIEHDLARAGGTGKVVIFYGHSEDKMLDELRKGGWLPADAVTGTMQ